MKINKKYLPKVYILKYINPRDWLLIFLATVISTTVASYPEVTIDRMVGRTFIVALTLFLMLLVIDMIIYLWKEHFLKD